MGGPVTRPSSSSVLGQRGLNIFLNGVG